MHGNIAYFSCTNIQAYLTSKTLRITSLTAQKAQITLKNTRNTLQAITQMDWECVGIHVHTHTHTHPGSSARVETAVHANAAFSARTRTPARVCTCERQHGYPGDSNMPALHLINIQLLNANEAHARARITPATPSNSKTIIRKEIE